MYLYLKLWKIKAKFIVYNIYYDKDISILNHLFRCLGNKVSVTSTYENWLLWLYIKVYGNTGSKYIDYVAKDSISVHNLMDLIYFMLVFWMGAEKN